MTADLPPQVIATAGHVDHGKSALVRALTGIEPDRWAEERRRGMTIGLGYAWTRLPSGRDAAFVDVPGHERFITTMLAGVGSVPVVLLVVAADEGWSAQTQEHLDVIDALGVRHGLLAVTKSDLADPAPVAADALERVAASSLGPVDWVSVSAVTGAGLVGVRTGLDRLLAALPSPDERAPLRLWVDRSFSIRGAGTVVTGTLGAGRIAIDDELEIVPGGRRVRVRGLQSEERSLRMATPVRRVAVNLRGIEAADLRRGHALVGVDDFPAAVELDVVLAGGELSPLVDGRASGVDLVAHIGSAAVPARLRPLGGAAARVRLATPLPLRLGDRLLLRDPGRRVVAGADVADVDPLPLRGRGSASARAAELASPPTADSEVRRRGLVAVDWLRRVGHDEPTQALRVARWWCSRQQITEWCTALMAVLSEAPDNELPLSTLRRELGLPDRDVLALVLAEAPEITVTSTTAHLADRHLSTSSGLVGLVRRLATDPLDAPDGTELSRLQVPAAELSRAIADGRLVALTRGVYVGPNAVATATERLHSLPGPFTPSEAAAALGVSRRVAVPLLEHLDRLRVTRRIDAGSRELRSRQS